LFDLHFLDSNCPGWLIEGMADYARYQFGVNNDAVGWKLPNYQEGQDYTNGYQVTAAFLKYVDSKYPGTSQGLFDVSHAMKYTACVWVTLTGKTVDQLWSEYAAAGSA
jgi:hypothetical protein